MNEAQRAAAERLAVEMERPFSTFAEKEAAALLRELAVEPQGKPVAWWIPKAEQFALAKKDGSRPFAKAWEPLYAAPQQRTPLSDEVVAKLINDEWATPDVPSAWKFARAIEKAHGTGEEA